MQVAANASDKRDGTAKPSVLAARTGRQPETVAAKKGLSAIERAQRKRAKRAAASDHGVENMLDDLLRECGDP